jgi:hypothetical protein
MSAAVLRSKRAARGESAAGAKAAALRTRGKSRQYPQGMELLSAMLFGNVKG